jgi:hypothetical protein
MGHVSRSSGLHRLETSLIRVSQSSLKTSRGMEQMVHMTSSWRPCEDEADDRRVDVMGCIGVFYPNFAVFIVLGHKDSLVISFLINKTPRVGGEDQTFNHPSPTP